MFNILIIVALSAILAGKVSEQLNNTDTPSHPPLTPPHTTLPTLTTHSQTLYLDWRPLCRDAFVYGSSIVLFIGFSWDGQLEWYEVTILLVIYICYILLMKISSSIMGLLELLTCRSAGQAAARQSHCQAPQLLGAPYLVCVPACLSLPPGVAATLK